MKKRMTMCAHPDCNRGVGLGQVKTYGKSFCGVVCRDKYERNHHPKTSKLRAFFGNIVKWFPWTHSPENASTRTALTR